MGCGEDAGQSGRGDFLKYLQVQCPQSLSGLYYPVQTVMTETKREQQILIFLNFYFFSFVLSLYDSFPVNKKRGTAMPDG